MLCKRLLIQAETACTTKSAKQRAYVLMRISHTLFAIARPKFDSNRLVQALRTACLEAPEFGDPVVREGGRIHLNGSFSLEKLSNAYFVEAPTTIDGEKVK